MMVKARGKVTGNSLRLDEANNWTSSKKATAWFCHLERKPQKFLQALDESRYKKYVDLIKHLEMWVTSTWSKCKKKK